MTRITLAIGALDFRRTAGVLFGAIVVIGIGGVLALWLDPGNPWFDLDVEIGLAWPPTEITLALPAIWSTLTFAFAGMGWLAVGWLSIVDVPRVAALGFGALLLFFAFDDLFKVHERIEGRTGIDWQVLYVPVAAAATVMLATLVWRLRRRGRGISAMLVGGGLCWVIALVLEFVQWYGGEKVELYVFYMVPEELLELASNALYALAAIATLQSASVVPGAGPPPARLIGGADRTDENNRGDSVHSSS